MEKAKLPREGKKYSQEELELLEELVGTTTFIIIGEKLGRSAKAVERQLTRMGLVGTKAESGLISNLELCRALQVHHKVTMRWKEKFDLPLRKKNLRFGKQKHNSWFIDPVKFWRWAKKNKELVNWSKYVPDSLIPEPDWLQEAIKLHLDTKPKKQRAFWTPEEDNRLWQLFYVSGLTQKEIAVILDRSLNAVEKRLKRLREEKLKGGEV
ncbi:SANT SWI3, ADA2, N-CoR and TFIIIB'' DNA-binding domain protein [Lysinibacillus phage vB_LfM_LysYB1]|nr:SANT SWI3, ADA2, N-CoR and TFIIIB'' DNA-binding domain protein [Lysinibacillus phage vB_LfM_LysYB1]WAB25348.1 SANT SWI3, ADA2, N-CoR and TFIIIB'' DNA-binding domain protein [Lysinibacillus phage vB_LfM_LysYB2]